MKNLIERLKQLAAKLAGIKEGLPDQASLEKGSVAAAAVTNVQIQIASGEALIAEVQQAIEAAELELANGPSDDQKTAIIDAALASGLLVKKADADAAAQLALAAKETELKNTFEATRQAEAASAAARTKLAETCKLGAAAVAAVPVEVCAAADFETVGAPKIKDRLDQLTALGITVPAIQAEVCAMSLDAAGDTAFTAKLDAVKAMAAALKGTTPQAPFTQEHQPGTPVAMAI